MGEITVILLLALIFLGPKKLPELASGLGRMIRQLRKITSDVKNEIVLDDAIRKPFEELRDAVTLHPDELKRRDNIKQAIEEARQRLEAEAAAANAQPANPDENAEAPVDPAAMAEGPAPDAPPPPIPPRPTVTPPFGVAPPRAVTPPLGVAAPAIPPPPPSFRPSAPPSGTVARRPTPAPIPPPPPRFGARVTPPVSSQDGDRANITQVLAEEDLMPPNRTAPPALPPPLPGVAPPPPPAPKKS